MKRNPQIIIEAKRKQSFCSRCFKRKDLVGHHKHALGDGGPDTLENIDVLCGHCHNEWHRYFEPSSVDYSQFIELPMISVLVRLIADEESEDLTLSDITSMWTAHRLDQLRAELATRRT